MAISVPYKGRAIPINYITYSSETIAEGVTSRNIEQEKGIGEIREIIGGGDR
jgi:hypothetical protein